MLNQTLLSPGLRATVQFPIFQQYFVLTEGAHGRAHLSELLTLHSALDLAPMLPLVV